MLVFLILVGVVTALVFRATTPEDRARFLSLALNELQQARAAEARMRVKCEPYHAALRERMRWALVAPALVAANLLLVVLMKGSDPATLVDWGASFGPRTTNGEWWRVITSMFVHAGLFQALVNVAALLQVGLILERFVGRLTFAAVYLASGLLGGLAAIATRSVDVTYGASAAIFGLYGLLLASSFWSRRSPTSVTISWIAAARLAPLGALFVLYNMGNDSLPAASEWTGLVTGIVCGLVLTKAINDDTPEPRFLGKVMAVAGVIAIACAIPLRRIANVKPEIARVVAIEDRTVGEYRDAFERLKKGQMNAEAVAQLIEKKIVPELQAAESRLETLERVPSEHRPIVDGAGEYLRLRRESWQLRADGLRKSTALARREAGREQRTSDASWRIGAEQQYRANLVTLGRAEGSERASLEALQHVIAAMEAAHVPGN